jgi:hypothetical protein
MKTEEIIITPEIAADWLSNRNPRNRSINSAHVASLAKDMEAGRWKMHGQPIQFSVDNILLDGQHRLAAILKSGVPIKSLVVTELPSDVFSVIDTGKRRSAADTLLLEGEKNTVRLAAALALVHNYMTGRGYGEVRYTTTEVQELLQKYPGVRDSIRHAGRVNGVVAFSVLDSCHYLFAQKDPELADVFVDKIMRGVGLDEGHPFYVLRERLMKNSMSKAKLRRADVMALCIKAWNAARKGKTVTRFHLAKDGEIQEAFPIVV